MSDSTKDIQNSKNSSAIDSASATQAKTKKEPLFHITKRANLGWKYALLIRAGAILLSFIVMCLLIIILAQENPFKLIGAMFAGLFGEPLRVWRLFSNTSILLLIALALTPAFKMKFWNCGGEGQVIIACLMSAMMMFFLGDALPLPVLIILMILSSIAIGAIWALIPAIFKAIWNTNETLLTLMMNYLAIQCVTFFLKQFGNKQGNLDPMLDFALPEVFGGPYFVNIVMALGTCIVMFVYINFTKQGYEISVVGESERTARYIGIRVPWVIIRTLLISGAICGYVGFLLVANGSCSVTTTITGGRGFTAILVSWMAKFNPLYMILTAFLVVFLQQGTSYMGDIYRLDTSLADIFIGIVLFFIIGCEFFINYKINFRNGLFDFAKKNKEAK